MGVIATRFGLRSHHDRHVCTVRPRRRLSAALAGAVCLVLMMIATAVPAPGQTASPAPMRSGVAFGDELVWKSDAQLAESLDSATALGVNWIRVDLSWADIQYDGPTSYHWELFDRVLAAASARNLQVIAVLAYTPQWARRAGCPNQSCPPRDTQEFARFAQLAATRYAPLNLHHWEIWNEPNIPVFWNPKPDAAAYTRLLKATVVALRQTDPKATLLLGGLSASDGTGVSIAQVPFLAEVTRLGGTQLVDVLAFHPYTFPVLASTAPIDPRGWRTSWSTIHGNLSMPAGQFYSLRQVLNSYGLSRMPIWVTEYGGPTGGPGAASDGNPASIGVATHVTEQRQAELATDVVKTAMADPTIGALVWYSEKDRSFRADDTENFFGLRRADGTRKPAWYALRDALQSQRSLRPTG